MKDDVDDCAAVLLVVPVALEYRISSTDPYASSALTYLPIPLGWMGV